MKLIIAISLMFVVGCSPSSSSTLPPVQDPVVSCPLPPACKDHLTLLTDEELSKGFMCPAGTKMAFPSYFSNNGKVLVQCQCR